MFDECTSLTTVSINTKKAKRWLDDASPLQSLTFGSSVEIIDANSFSNYPLLTSIRMNEGLQIIGQYAFSNTENCPGVTELTIPSSVKGIGEAAFAGFVNLKNVTIFSKDASIVNGALGMAWEEIGDGQYRSYPVEGFTITGYRGSTAEAYAKRNGFAFIPLDPVSPFTDVEPGKYYYDAVLWAISQDPPVTNGTDDTHFSPNKTCTRGQVVTFLWNAMGQPAPDPNDNPFVDVKPGKYYTDAVLWAYQTGATTGTDATHFSPGKDCTRGQVVTFLWNAMGKPEPETTDNPFTDVKEGKFYYKAVLWAVENGVTNGTSDTTFSPNKTCTRGQVVTFLYNDLAK